MNQVEVEGGSDARGLTVGVAAATYNKALTDRLLAGCLQALEELKAETVIVLRVPGALELPLAADALARRGCAAVVAIGAVVKGETDHYEVVVREAASGLSRVSLDRAIPVTNAILAVHDYAQGLERSEPGPGNRGAEAARAAVEMAVGLGRL